MLLPLVVALAIQAASVSAGLAMNERDKRLRKEADDKDEDDGNQPCSAT